MAIAVGALVSEFFMRPSAKTMAAAGGLLLWQTLGSVATHPDYLADFNIFAGKHPERILIDSDLDWGQDLKRLRQEITKRQIDNITVAYHGYANVERHIPNYHKLDPALPVTGWVAISLTILATSRTQLEWLTKYQPITRVGRSFDLYFIEPNNGPANNSPGAVPP